MFQSILQNNSKRRFFFCIVGLIVWAAISLSTTLTFLEIGRDEYSKKGNDVLSAADGDDFIYIELRLQYQDLSKRSVKYYIEMQPFGKYLNNETLRWNTDVQFDFLHKKYTAKNGTTVEPVTFEAPLITGNTKDYPFDKYSSSIAFLALDNSTEEVIPVTIATSVFTQNTYMNFVSDPEFKDEHINLQVYNVIIKRTAIVYTFCFFISAVTWGLTIAILNLAIDSAFLNRDLGPPFMALGVSMLFAMPTLRKTQPDIPEVGCAIDFLCFIWCEILIAIASCLIIFTYWNQWKYDHGQPSSSTNNAATK